MAARVSVIVMPIRVNHGHAIHDAQTLKSIVNQLNR